MLLRAVGRSTSHILATTRKSIGLRTISMTKMMCGGGGHHHHEITPVYIPQPGSLDWSLCGTPGVKRVSPDTAYTPGPDDFTSFFGAAVFVALTLAAVIYKTDAFKKPPHFEQHLKAQAAIKHGSEKESEKEEVATKVEEVVEPEASTSEEPAAPASAAVPVAEEKPAAEEVPEEKEPVVKPSVSEPEIKEEVKKEEEKHEKSVEEAQQTPTTSTPAESKPSTSGAEEKSEESTSTESKENRLYCEYVIIGSGTAAYYASLAIRAKKGEAKVLMIGEEEELPYNRPPLSKELWWYGDESSAKKLDYVSLSGKKRDIFYEVEGFFVKPDELPLAVHGGVSLIRGTKVIKICPEDKKVILEDGTTIGYGKVLIATGNRPKPVELFEEASEEAKQKITYYHYPADFKKVESGLADKTVQKITIVGNGLLASELAYSIKRKYENVEVHQVYEQNYNADDVLPEHLAKKSTEALQKMGVIVHNKEKLNGVRKCCKNVVLKLKDGSELRSDMIVVADGEQVNNELAEASGLKINSSNGGVTTDKYLKVAENIWAAGSVASFDDSVLGTRRLSSWEHAQISGRLAGENMTKRADEGKSFWYQPSFFTKFAPHLHLNAVGNVDAKLDTVTVYADPSPDTEIERAVVFYKAKETGNIVGVLLVNVFGPSLDVARRIIDDKKQFDDLKELAKLFPLYEPPKSEDKEKKTEN